MSRRGQGQARWVAAGVAALALSGGLIWLLSGDEDAVVETPPRTQASKDQLSAPVPDSGRAGTEKDQTKTSAQSVESFQPRSLRAEHERADDLFDFYLVMRERGEAGDGEATYRAALALHECALALNESVRAGACGATSIGEPFFEKSLACEQSSRRCSGFTGRTAEDLTRERDEWYVRAAEQGYERAIARQLSQWMEDEPETAEDLAADILADTTDFGALYHLGNYLSQRLYREKESWIGGGWSEERDGPDGVQRWGSAAWELAACRIDHGCPDSSIFMRSACLYGDGCQAGWSYADYIRYYRSPYDMARIETLSQEIYEALLNRDVDRLMGRG